MTTTPTIWRPSFTVNSGFTAGTQTVPQTIGLKNGNILVVWEDTSDINGPSPFTDVVGRILDPEGSPVGNPFQLNTGIVGSDETGPKIVALPDGGFVMAYGGYDSNLGGFIAVQRYDSNGGAPFSYNLILDTALSSLTKWEITADSVGNYTVVFERKVLSPAASIDIHSFTYDFSTNVRGPERTNIAQNSTEDDRLAATAAFANGHVLAFYTEPDYDFFGNRDETVEFRIIDPATGALIRDVELDDGDPLEDSFAKDVAVLTGGQFVLVYYEPHFPVGYAFRVVNTETSAIGPHVDIPDLPDANGIRFDRGVHVVAMQDGGFFIASLELAGVLYGQRYGAYGDPIGARFPIAENVGSFASNDLSLTSDGRILVVYRNTAGEIAQVILDPRENTIFGTDAGEVLTTQIGNTQISGLGGNDTLLGQGGNDRLDGGADRDTLDGGSGDDTYILADLSIHFIILDPLLVILGYDSVVEAAGGGIDTVRVRRVSSPDSTANGGYQLTANVENGLIEGSQIFDLTGNELANRLTGNSAANILSGLAGDDRLDGGSGDDSLSGDAGNDRLNGGDGNDNLGGGDGDDYLTGLAGDETMNGNTGNDSMFGGLGNDTLNGGDGDDNMSAHPGDDTMNGSLGRDTMFGGGDRDIMSGGDGNDTVFGQAGDDNLGTGLSGNIGDDMVNGGGGDDLINGHDGDDTLYGSAGNDVVNGGTGADFMHGGSGNDALNGQDQGDIMFGFIGDDTMNGGAGEDMLNGGDGNDTLRGGDNFDRIVGALGNDALWGDAGNDHYIFDDGWGDDTVHDFANNGLEKINLFAVTGIAARSDLTITDAAGGATIVFGANSIFVAGVAAAQLDNADFIF